MVLQDLSELAALGPRRIAIAARAAVAAAGGAGVGTEQENQIARWFVAVVDEAIARGGPRAAAAIWFVLAHDRHPDPDPSAGWSGWSTRCPAIAEVPDPPIAFAFLPGDRADLDDELAPDPDEVATFLAALHTAAAGYVYTAIAGASADDLRALDQIMRAGDAGLDAYHPWGDEFGSWWPSWLSLESSRSLLTRRLLSNAEACHGVANWADGFKSVVTQHAISPVFRIGAIAWLARVALRPAGGAA